MKRKRQAAPKGQPASPGSADPNVLLLERPKPGETKGGVLAGMLVAGLLSNAVAAREWSQVPFNRDTDLTATLANVVRAAERVNRGDLTSAEAVLTAQAFGWPSMLSLNAGRRARRWPCSRTPRTAEGKARSSRNAYRGGHRQNQREVARLLALLAPRIEAGDAEARAEIMRRILAGNVELFFRCLELAEAKTTEWPRKRLPSRPPGQRQPERTMLMSLRMTIRQTIEAKTALM